MKSLSVTIQMKVILSSMHFPVVLFIMLYMQGCSNFQVSTHEISRCDHSNESYLGSPFLWYCLLSRTKLC